MGFFKDLTIELDRVPAPNLAPWRGEMSEVLKYAPLKSRARRTAEERLAAFETEKAYWRERALRAEGRVKYLESSIERIAQLPAARRSRAG